VQEPGIFFFKCEEAMNQAMSQAINLEDEAVSYAARGWLVFPAPPGQKKSYKSAEYSNGQRWGATSDADEIRRDFARWPDANIGIPTGPANKIFVVEADTKQGHGVDGIASLKQLETDYGPLPETLMAESPSGSVHYYFNCPKVGIVRNSASKIAPGIDVRGEGGMVIAPPSVREDGVYRWIHRNPIADVPEWLLRLVTTPAEAPQRELPDWLRDILAGKGHAGLGSSSDPADLPPPVDRKKIDDALAAIDPDIDRGPWFEIGCALYAALGDELGFKLWDLWSFGGKKYHGEDMIPQWRSIVEGNYAYTANTIFHYAGQANKSQEQINPDTLIQSSAEFVANFTPPDYLIDGLIQRRFVYSMTAPTGAGKTCVALRIAAHVALGLPLDGREVERGKVLFFAGENPDDVRMRWIKLCEEMAVDPNDMDVFFLPGSPPISNDEIRKRINAEAAKHGPFSLLIVDTSAAYFTGDDENSNAQLGAHARMMRSFVNLPGGPAIIVTCHPTKTPNMDNLLPRGGGAFIAEMDGNFVCMKDDPIVNLHWHGKFRGPDFAPISFKLNPGTSDKMKDVKGRLIWTVTVEPISEGERIKVENAGRSRQDELLRILNAGGLGLSLAEMATKLGWHTKKGEPNKTLVNRTLHSLIKDKLVERKRGKLAFTPAGERAAEEAEKF
jgi:hypothetical protein